MRRRSHGRAARLITVLGRRAHDGAVSFDAFEQSEREQRDRDADHIKLRWGILTWVLLAGDDFSAPYDA